VEDFLGETAGIFRCPEHQRRHCADERRLRSPALAVPCQIVRYLAPAGGMADVNGILQAEMRGQSRKVVCIMVHVMALARLAGATVTTAIMGDHSIAVIWKEQHLRVPVIGRERPAMREHHRLTRTPILVINLGAVLGLDRWHYGYSCFTPSFGDTRGPAIGKKNRIRAHAPECRIPLRRATRRDEIAATRRRAR